MGSELLEYRRPPYPLESVDNALRALHLLRDYGSVRIADVADRLGIAPSTAHRIMSMLVYQGFSVKDDYHCYFPGPALTAPLNVSERVQPLTTAARPILTGLAAELSEVVSLSIRIGVHIRVLLTVGEVNTNDFGDRSGSVYPAHSTSGGRALLAVEQPTLVEKLYLSDATTLSGSTLSEAAYSKLIAELDRTRRRGYAITDEEVHRGMSSVAIPVVLENGSACAVIVMLPPARLAPFRMDDSRMSVLREAGRTLSATLSRAGS